MTAVLCQAANMEDRVDDAHDVITRLQRENHAMRELLQLEMLAPSDELTHTDGEKPPSCDAAIQTQTSPDDDPFCTGDFATIRPRPVSSRTPPSTDVCTAGETAPDSPCPESKDDKVLCSKFPPSQPANSADISPDRLVPCTADDRRSLADDCTLDEVGDINSSESLETLVNPSDLSEDDTQADIPLTV